VFIIGTAHYNTARWKGKEGRQRMRKPVLAAAALAIVAAALAGCLPVYTQAPGTQALGALWYPVNAPKENDYLVVPGERIGRFYIGMTLGELKAMLGEPDLVEGRTPFGIGMGYHYAWKGLGLSREGRYRPGYVVGVSVVSESDNGQVFSIRLRDSRSPAFGTSPDFQRDDPREIALQEEIKKYRTREGFGIGSTLAGVSAAYGAAGPVHGGQQLVEYSPIPNRKLVFAFPDRDPRATAFALVVYNRAVHLYLVDQWTRKR